MAKKNPYVTTVGFNKDNPDHVKVAEFLNSMGRGKADYITKIFMAYQRIAGNMDLLTTKEVFDYEKIKGIVLQILAEHEHEAVTKGVQSSSSIKTEDVRKENKDKLDEAALDDIMSSIEAFRSG